MQIFQIFLFPFLKSLCSTHNLVEQKFVCLQKANTVGKQEFKTGDPS